MKINDRLFGVLMVVLAVAYGWGATQIPEPFGGSEAVGPDTFPKILAVILGICGVYMMLKPDEGEAWPIGKTLLELFGAVAVLVSYTLLLEPLGFVLTTTLAVGTLSLRLGARWLPAYATGLISALVVFVAFNYGLELPLPIGFGR
jgi:putative tricarboxylic transport membrane protein